MPARDIEIRCFCRRTPLLAVAGRDQKTGEPFVWLKVHKQNRIQAEMVATSGKVHLRCRECLRWTLINIERVALDVVPSDLSSEVTATNL